MTNALKFHFNLVFALLWVYGRSKGTVRLVTLNIKQTFAILHLILNNDNNG
jgi:hypothetical protein